MLAHNWKSSTTPKWVECLKQTSIKHIACPSSLSSTVAVDVAVIERCGIARAFSIQMYGQNYVSKLQGNNSHSIETDRLHILTYRINIPNEKKNTFSNCMFVQPSIHILCRSLKSIMETGKQATYECAIKCRILCLKQTTQSITICESFQCVRDIIRERATRTKSPFSIDSIALQRNNWLNTI